MTARNDALEKIAHLRRRAYRPVLEDEDGQPIDSKLGGTPYLPSEVSWPNCGNCSKPLALILQINTAQLPEPLRKEFGSGLIQLFYCLSSEPHCEVDAQGWAPFSITHNARLVKLAGETIENGDEPPGALSPKRIASWSVGDDYPNWEEREALGVELDDAEDTLLDDATIGGDKLVGWPNWVQGIEYPLCIECGKKMRLVFQLDSDDGLDYGWGDSGCAHLTACPTHKHVLAFAWACA